MVNLETKARQCLKEFDLRTLFIEEMGWDHHISSLEVLVDDLAYLLKAVAQKRGMVVFVCSPADDGPIPDYSTRRKIERQVAKSVHEHLIIYTDKDHKFQIWQWVKREAGKPTQCREHSYYRGQPGDALIQKLQHMVFTLEDEEKGPTVLDSVGRVRAAFDVDRVTKRFYDRFKSEHDTFLEFLKGIPDEERQRWYASVMLNRLMFIYFIQKKGFLDNNINYLRDKLTESKRHGKDRFYKDFLCPLFFEGFAKKENERKATMNQLLGEVPFLNGGIFQPHQLEELYGKTLQIADVAFEKLFSFFDQYQWHLDERPLRADNEINPDVLGYIFEKYINQKQMGAYYTKEDITEYISKNTIIPYLFDEVRKKCKIAFEGEQSIWRLLQADPDRYIYDAVKKGVDIPLPPEIAAGLNDVSKRTEWNKPAPEEYALPAEIWREVVARRKRYEEVRSELTNGEIRDINDLITYNLNIRQFAQDVIENCEGPELLRAFWHAIKEVTILDPTCGSGAFLFAALNILQPLYEACLERMEIFLDEIERSGEKHRPEKFSDFRKVLDRIEQHPNRRYFIFKSIIVNNLYGVDIMDEAIEICKLRLFLKLVAQVERVENIEPLPDIDFNIRAGNTLIGYATYDEVKKAVLGDVQGRLDIGKDMQRIDEKAKDVDRLFTLFRQQQTEIGGEVSNADKQELRNRLKALEEELNRYLAGEYKIDPNNKNGYAKWLTSHKPFHWFIEFYGIVHKRHGFDVIIGNPPYVEYVGGEVFYKVQGYETETCGNLYPFIMERAIGILGIKGWFGMIAPIALGSTPRMNPLRDNIIKNANVIYYSNFADRPSCLFNGVHQILTICLLQKGFEKPVPFMSAGFNHWLKDERTFLFEKLTYVQSEQEIIKGTWGKFSNSTELAINSKIRAQKKSLVSYLVSHGKLLAVSGGTGGYWLRAFDEPQESKEYKERYVRDNATQLAVCAILNSTIFYWLWRKYSDCRHLTRSDIEKFNCDMNDNVLGKLPTLSQLQLSALKSTKETRLGKMTYEQYRPGQTKPLIDKIDGLLATHYCLTGEELDFIINYDIKYRMGRDAGEENEMEDA